jgi:hypothetical protein
MARCDTYHLKQNKTHMWYINIISATFLNDCLFSSLFLPLYSTTSHLNYPHCPGPARQAPSSIAYASLSLLRLRHKPKRPRTPRSRLIVTALCRRRRDRHSPAVLSRCGCSRHWLLTAIFGRRPHRADDVIWELVPCLSSVRGIAGNFEVEGWVIHC